MEIKYCDNCRSKIGSGELSAGTAKRSEEGKVYCHKCALLYEHTSSALLQVPAPASINDQTTQVVSVVQEPGTAVTKFYFCETCGKRITDKQILEGLGRDKKLKGVYCKDCAVGVMTMEMDAVNIEQLGKEKPKTPSGQDATKPTQRKGSGAVRLHDIAQRPHPPGKATTGAKNDRFPMLLAIGAAFVIGVIVTVVVMKQPSVPHERASQTVRAELARKLSPPPETPLSASPVKSNISEQSPIAPEPSVPEKKTVLLNETPKSSLPIEKAPSTSPVEATPAGPQATEMKPQEPAAPLPVIAPVDKGRDQFAAVLKDLAPLMRQSHFNDAEKLLNEKLRDPAFEAAAESLKKEKEDLAEIRALRHRAIDALRTKSGSTVTLTMRGAKITGTVKDDSNHTDLALALRDGPEMTIRADQLDVQDVDAYAPVETGIAKAKDLGMRGLLFLAAEEMAKAEEYFTKARDAGLGNGVMPYLERIKALKSEAREAAAFEVWKKAEGLFASKNWKAAKQAYEALERDYAGSAALANNAMTLKERLEAIGWALGPPREISLDLGGGVKIELVLIPAGEFEMGSNDGRPDEKPVHKVKIAHSFYIGKYVVTQAQFEKVIGKNPSDFKGENLPVEKVSYSDAEEFCKKADNLTGKSFRLPTEAEWEFACRAGTKTKYNTGDNDAALEQAGWHKGNSEDKTHPVGQKKPNALGLYDMHGNVWQWCQDWYADDYYGKSPATDPEGPAQGASRLLRGGSWYENPGSCRTANRGSINPAYRGTNIGFRVAVVPAVTP